jgi:hypothetical protein
MSANKSVINYIEKRLTNLRSTMSCKLKDVILYRCQKYYKLEDANLLKNMYISAFKLKPDDKKVSCKVCNDNE